MKNNTFIKKLLVSVTTLSLFPLPHFNAQEATDTFDSINQAYLDAVDPTYGYNIALQLGEFGTHETLGYRPAGSQAEHDAAEYLFNEMQALGLSNVSKDVFPVDAWTFEKADLTFTDINGNEHQAMMGGYQINFNTNGPKEFDIIYAGKGTEDDLANLDIEGKFLLVDINQREEWWVTYPALQAKYKGAAGIIVVQEASFSEISPDSLNANDFCGPDDAPAFSMSQTDANALKDVLAANDNQISVTLDAVSTVERDGEAYNIVGEIPGKNTDESIIISAHYDAYFEGFQDNSIAVGLMLGIAKAMLDSNYQPEKNIIFFAVAAEEWGAVDTRYDWSNGAYNQLFSVRPEWQDQAMYNINFEMPAVDFFDYHQLLTVPELTPFIQSFVDDLPELNEASAKGIEIVSPLTTWADDWSFSIAGIPSVRNDFTDADFGVTTYHTEFDNKDTYDEAIFEFNHMLYGLLALEYDRTAVLPLDFNRTLDTLQESIQSDVFAQVSVDDTALQTTIDEIRPLVTELNVLIATKNQAYFEALNNNQMEDAEAIYNETRELNRSMKDVYRYIQDNFAKLTWEDVQQFPHELATNNLDHLIQSQTALEANNPSLALDEHLWLVDNNWYAYDFSREVYDHVTNYVMDQPDERLFWGAGRVVGHLNLYDLINQLQAKVNNPDADFTEELVVLSDAIANQTTLLDQLVTKEVTDLQTIQEKLQTLLN
ncbi:M28 family peptidase [Fundicoccus culcitae]|uniref:M28 family peptidase n=1 Tax=Fundicoccus culcitae TaxID=2969821 RepID=A0ABY5P7C7_9LACT|nr:M28 family peptidase [Fundicoccus culcitae]UUX34641.1 M28 family peptidase [Fundicoccus culcitae]